MEGVLLSQYHYLLERQAAYSLRQVRQVRQAEKRLPSVGLYDVSLSTFTLTLSFRNNQDAKVWPEQGQEGQKPCRGGAGES